MADELITLTIDGAEVSVAPGTMLIEAAKQTGVLVPHYCYHPGLPLAGVCRMCLVEVENAPKLQIACWTPVQEGMVVRTQSEQAKNGRQGVLELLLINHPLDCPICDQAGECELQDFTFAEGRAGTRYQEDAKRFNPVEEFGPDVLYVPNRCILCTRCERFMSDVAGDPVLNVSERGDRAYIGIHPDATLDHPWAGNVVDICPVGSLLSKEFLHKARAWDLDKSQSVCTACSQGCNVMIDTREDVVVRIRPRTNLDVNHYWMCDHGRRTYKWMNQGDRLEAPLVNHEGDLRATDWDTALSHAASLLNNATGKAVVLASPRASLEALAQTRRLVASFDWTGAVRVDTGTEHPLPGVPNLALRKERAPNVRGAKLLGYGTDHGAAVEAAKTAAVVVVLDDELGGVEQLETAGQLLYLGTTLPETARHASVVLPIANVAEEDGTFMNRDGRVQRYRPAKTAPGMSRPAWWVCAELLVATEGAEPAASASEVFALIAELGELTYDGLGLYGTVAGSEVVA